MKKPILLLMLSHLTMLFPLNVHAAQRVTTCRMLSNIGNEEYRLLILENGVRYPQSIQSLVLQEVRNQLLVGGEIKYDVSLAVAYGKGAAFSVKIPGNDRDRPGLLMVDSLTRAAIRLFVSPQLGSIDANSTFCRTQIH